MLYCFNNKVDSTKYILIVNEVDTKIKNSSKIFLIFDYVIYKFISNKCYN